MGLPVHHGPLVERDRGPVGVRLGEHEAHGRAGRRQQEGGPGDATVRPEAGVLVEGHLLGGAQRKIHAERDALRAGLTAGAGNRR